MSLRPRALAGALWLATAAPITLRARAAEPAHTAQNRTLVAIEVAGATEVVERVRSVATEVLGRLGVAPVVTREPAQQSTLAEPEVRPLAYAYIDLEDPHLPRLVFVDGATSRELTRRTLPRATSIETSTEAVTLVLYMLVESLLAAPASTSTTAPAEPAPAETTPVAPRDTPAPPAPLPERASPRRPAGAGAELDLAVAPVAQAPDDVAATDASRKSGPSWVSVELSAFGRLLMLGDTSPVAGAGGTLGFRSTHFDPRLGLLLLGAAHFPSTHGYRGATSRITPYSARLFMTLDFPLTRLLRASFALGGGVDWFHTELERAPAEADVRGATSFDPIVSAQLGGRAAFARHFALDLALGLDLDAAPRDFVVQVGPERHALLELARLRPSLLLGLAWTSGARAP